MKTQWMWCRDASMIPIKINTHWHVSRRRSLSLSKWHIAFGKLRHRQLKTENWKLLAKCYVRSVVCCLLTVVRWRLKISFVKNVFVMLKRKIVSELGCCLKNNISIEVLKWKYDDSSLFWIKKIVLL